MLSRSLSKLKHEKLARCRTLVAAQADRRETIAGVNNGHLVAARSVHHPPTSHQRARSSKS